MKIVVTGALGHIGSAFIRAAAAEFPGAEIVMIDNLSTQRFASLMGLPEGASYSFYEADVRTANLNELFQGASVVLHLAAITNATESFDKGKEVEEVNYGGTRRVAEACADLGCPLIFLSTTSVYGSQSNTVDENCPVSDLRPQSPYADSKLKAEQCLAEISAARGLRFINCRFGTIFGTSIGMRFHTAINKFCWQVTLGQPLSVWKIALNQKRPYLELNDAVRALVFIIKRELYDCRTYNVVTVNSTVSGIVDIIRSRVPDAVVELVDTPIMNQLSYEVLDARFREAGFTVTGDLRAGIYNTLDTLAAIRTPPRTVSATRAKAG
jgi:UDP-glucose 4-epimerase